MSKFKVGDSVFSIREGFTLVSDIAHECLRPVCAGKNGYLLDGRLYPQDAYPSLYTLDEARRMGFPVPAEPVVFEAFMDPQGKGWTVGRGFKPDYAPLAGKRVRVTVEVAE